ncbi:NAD(P)/FAD-dependent oxidoreductase [Streptomyces sp. NBC_01511]|uniref:NAD(P)-binding protein n=1 Tax=Streptomyces sp. NBC_01511 TaxID=2903889 RepID=UPI003868AE87
MARYSDEELGMRSKITRRDFLDGAAVAVAGAAAATALPGLGGTAAAATAHPKHGTHPTHGGHGHGGHGRPPAYPPTGTGLQGQPAGSYDVGHAVRDGDFDPGRIRDSGERYDLVVVGGGISGLAAAYYYRQQHGRRARILILEAMDDFGGHARRNEFEVRGRTLLSNAGTVNLDTPSTWTKQAHTLVTRDLGIDLKRLGDSVDDTAYDTYALTSGTFFDSETWGTDRLVVRGKGESWQSYAARMPMTDQGRADLVTLQTTTVDYYPGLSDARKKEILARISYERYLRDKVGIGDEAIAHIARATNGLYGLNADGVPAADAASLGQPGFAGLALEHTTWPGISGTAQMHLDADEGDGYYYFPDGNASVARLLVSHLVPGVFGGAQSMTGIVTAKARYDRLDEERSPVRVRLGSTAYDVRHVSESRPGRGVKVSYSRGGESYRVHAANAVMACWNSVTSYVVRGLPPEQAEAMRYGVKIPLLYARVALRDWRALADAGVSRVSTPTSYFNSFGLPQATRLGRFEMPHEPSLPTVLSLSKTPNKPRAGLSARQQHKAGRVELVKTEFATFEREIRDTMARSLGDHGFDPGRDISAITVNRWAHGYAYEYNSLDDPSLFEPEEKRPYALARRSHGRIAIANSDAQAFAYTHAAIDEAYRAVRELG